MKTVVAVMTKAERQLIEQFIGEDLGTDNIDFNRLMPVVEKIQCLGEKVDGNIKHLAYVSIHVHITCTGFQAKWTCSILGSMTYSIPINKTQHTYETIDVPHITIYAEDSFKKNKAIIPVYKAVVEFIKWYNTQQKP